MVKSRKEETLVTDLKETFDNAGIPAAYFDVSSFQDYLDLLELFTRLTGHPERYAQYGTAVQEQVDEAKHRASLRSNVPTVLTIQVSGSSVKVKNSEDNVLGPMLKELGCINIADRDGALLEDLSMEEILAEDPDFIFVTVMGSSTEKALNALAEGIQQNPAWQSLSAVQNGRYVILPGELFHYKPNRRWGESYVYLAEILYPELAGQIQ